VAELTSTSTVTMLYNAPVGQITGAEPSSLPKRSRGKRERVRRNRTSSRCGQQESSRRIAWKIRIEGPKLRVEEKNRNLAAGETSHEVFSRLSRSVRWEQRGIVYEFDSDMRGFEGKKTKLTGRWRAVGVQITPNNPWGCALQRL